MRKLKLTLALLAAACLFAGGVLAVEFDKTVSVAGGSGQRLSVVLTANGYGGSLSLKELTLCNPSGAANTLYVGNSSSVNASTGFPLEAGVCVTWRATGAGDAVDSTSKYLFTAGTQDAGLSARSQ